VRHSTAKRREQTDKGRVRNDGRMASNDWGKGGNRLASNEVVSGRKDITQLALEPGLLGVKPRSGRSKRGETIGGEARPRKSPACRANPIEPPWYVTRMPVVVGGVEPTEGPPYHDLCPNLLIRRPLARPSKIKSYFV